MTVGPYRTGLVIGSDPWFGDTMQLCPTLEPRCSPCSFTGPQNFVGSAICPSTLTQLPKRGPKKKKIKKKKSNALLQAFRPGGSVVGLSGL